MSDPHLLLVTATCGLKVLSHVPRLHPASRQHHPLQLELKRCGTSRVAAPLPRAACWQLISGMWLRHPTRAGAGLLDPQVTLRLALRPPAPSAGGAAGRSEPGAR